MEKKMVPKWEKGTVGEHAVEACARALTKPRSLAARLKPRPFKTGDFSRRSGTEFPLAPGLMWKSRMGRSVSSSYGRSIVWRMIERYRTAKLLPNRTVSVNRILSVGAGMLRRSFVVLAAVLVASLVALAQTDCAEGNGVLDTALPKGLTEQDLVQKMAAAETKVKEARSHYTYTQDVLVQTLNGKTVDGQFHEVTTVSYDDKGKRVENVTFAEQPTLRGIQLSAEDMDDIRVFMPWMLTTEELPQYKLTYAGQQHVDDLDTYVFHVEPKQEEKTKRYYQGRIWVDNKDLQIVKLCGKSVPEIIVKKKKQAQEIRPTFVTYRQLVDGNWFPAYVRVDDTLHFNTEVVQVREIIKFTGYKRGGPVGTKP